MIPQIGQHVKCILRTGVMVEGIIEEWGESVQLKSLDGESILIIPHYTNDIMMIKIMLPKKIENKEEQIISKNKLEKEFEEAYKQPSEENFRIKKLAELKKLLINQEKKIISEKIKDHNIEAIKKAEYGYPGFFTSKSIK